MKVKANNVLDGANYITKGVVYDVLEEVEDGYRIINDIGNRATYMAYRFDVVNESEEVCQSDWSDAHYASFVYTLTEEDNKAGSIKVDPYFVSKLWSIGTKDPSGVIWHIFKTCARFGEKNTKEREIVAIYKQIKRLAELEGVTLE